MKKLSMLRTHQGDPCPFGLDINSDCQRAGRSILKLAPLEILGPEATEEEKQLITNANKQFLEKNTDHTPCYFAKDIVHHNGVDCTYQEPNQGEQDGDAIVGSPYYYKDLSGTSVDGLYSFPRGYYTDNSVDRGMYYGMYSLEGIAAEKPHSMTKDVNKTELLMRNGMNKLAQDMDGISVRVSPKEEPEVKIPDMNDLRFDIVLEPESEEENQSLSEGGKLSGEMVLEIGDGVVEVPLNFELPAVPGGDFQDDIQPAITVEEPKDVEVVSDPWKWDVKTFLPWLQDKMKGIPKHSGKDTAGIERAVAYLEYLNKEISRAVRMDLRNDIAIEAVEAARDEIMKGIERLEERKEKIEESKYKVKRKKRADGSYELIKEAKDTGAGMKGVQVMVPLFISSLARSCIEGTISSGHDINQSYKKMVKEYALTKREQLELQRLISDMGFPVRRDFGLPLDKEKEVDQMSSDNIEFIPNYQA